jgi:hypothetical protein
MNNVEETLTNVEKTLFVIALILIGGISLLGVSIALTNLADDLITLL